MTVGQRLRSARESREMTIGDISRRTFIQPKFIQAIDEDNLGMIPDSHRRLFVREYAKLVGADAEEALALLAAFEPPPVPAAAEVVRRQGTSGRRDNAPAPPPAISALDEKERKAYGEVLRRLSSGRGMKLSGSNVSTWLISGAFVLLLLIAAYYIFFSDKNAHQDDAGALPGSAAGSPTEILARGGGDSASHDDGESAAGDDSLTLRGQATAKVWFAIVMDGKRSETGTLDSGLTKVWRAAETFKLSLGNAGGLALTLNDSAIGALGAMRTSVRNQIIDANGVRRSLPGRRTAPPPPRRSAQDRTVSPTEMRTSRP